MSSDLIQLTVQLEAASDADALEIDQLTSSLRYQLLELDVQSVDPVEAGDAPPGTRGGPLVMFGALLISMARSPEALKALIGTLQSWLASHQAHTVELQMGGDVLKVTGVSSAEQGALVALFIERHSH
jgi:hypothetical protein